MTVVAFALLIAFLALACWYPPVAVFIMAMTSIAGDGFGLNNYLRIIGLQSLAIGINVPVAVASLICCHRILLDRTGEFGPRAKFCVGVILAIAAWIPFAVLVKGGTISFALGNLMYTGIVVAPIAIAYARKPVARIIFAVLIVTQLVLAAIVVLAPGSPVGVLQGTQYTTGLGDLSGISQQFAGQVSRTSDQPRMFAQFIDPNTYGLYAVAGLALGSFLILRAGTFLQRVVGVVIIGLAVFGWITTFSRGTTIGFIIGVLLVVGGQVISRRITAWGAGAVATIILGGVAFAAIKMDTVRNAAESLSIASVSSEDVYSRLDAVRLGWHGFIGNPLFGVPLDFIWPNGIPPHELPFYMAAVYGALPGILVCVLLLAIVGSTRRFLFSPIPLAAQWETALAVLMGWLLLGTATTNNLSAPILFWVAWAIGANPWLSEPRSATYSASLRQHAARLNLRGGRRLFAPARRNAG